MSRYGYYTSKESDPLSLKVPKRTIECLLISDGVVANSSKYKESADAAFYTKTITEIQKHSSDQDVYGKVIPTMGADSLQPALAYPLADMTSYISSTRRSHQLPLDGTQAGLQYLIATLKHIPRCNVESIPLNTGAISENATVARLIANVNWKCLSPDCRWSDESESLTVKHYAEEHITVCLCGMPAERKPSRVICCRNCKQFSCTYRGCTVRTKCRSAIKLHCDTHFRSGNFDPRLTCQCGAPKLFQLDKKYTDCIYCKRISCTIANCTSQYKSKEEWLHHVSSSHPNEYRDIIRRCLTCGKNFKLRNTELTNKKCSNCRVNWCLEGDCCMEFFSLGKLLVHQNSHRST